MRRSAVSGSPDTAVFLYAAHVFSRPVLGKHFRITQLNGTRAEGTVTSLSSTALVVAVGGFTTSVPFDQIGKLEKSSHRIRNGMLVGLAAGAGLGGSIFVSAADGEAFVAIPFYARIGAGAGARIGAILHGTREDRDVLYTKTGAKNCLWPSRGSD